MLELELCHEALQYSAVACTSHHARKPYNTKSRQVVLKDPTARIGQSLDLNQWLSDCPKFYSLGYIVLTSQVLWCLSIVAKVASAFRHVHNKPAQLQFCSLAFPEALPWCCKIRWSVQISFACTVALNWSPGASRFHPQIWVLLSHMLSHSVYNELQIYFYIL